jgi:hypothetical protein
MAERFEGTLEQRGSGMLLEVPFDVRAGRVDDRDRLSIVLELDDERRTVAVPPELGAALAEAPAVTRQRAVCAARIASISSSRPTPFLRQLAAPAFSAASIICGSS